MKEIDYVLHRLSLIPESNYLPPIIDWTEEHRYMSRKTTSYPGPFSRKLAPHMVEITERFHPDDPCTHIALMKSVQSTGTTHVEFAMMYLLYHGISNVGFYTASKQLAERRSKTAIDPAIDDTRGLADKIKPLSMRNLHKKGDGTYMKEFAGGVKLLINTFNSIGDMKSITIPIIVIDEAEEMKAEMKGQGATRAIIEGRTMGVAKFKIAYITTPAEQETSVIYVVHREGDQRVYQVPCPECGEPSELTFKERTQKFGFTFMVDKNRRVIPETVGHICRFCMKMWYEPSKQTQMQTGFWLPTAVPQDPLRHSYHVSALMSPTPMLPWHRIATRAAMHDEGRDLLLYKEFVTNFHGKPWKRVKKKASSENFRENNVRDYTLGETDGSSLILFGGADVHKDRIEYSVWGFGPSRAKSLIDKQIYYGDIGNPDDSAWSSLADHAYNHNYSIDGHPVTVTEVAIDAGYDPKEPRAKDWNDKAHSVFIFCGRFPDKFVPIRGSRKKKAFDVIKAARTENSLCPKVYMVNTYLLKDILTNEIGRDDDSERFVFVPRWQMIEDKRMDLDDEIIEQILSERLQEDKDGSWVWKKTRARNEQWDNLVYATAMYYYRNVNTWSEEAWEAWKIRIFD